MNTMKKSVQSLVLLSTLFGATALMASAAPAPAPSGPEKVISVLPPDGSPGFDYTRRDLASALINYEAAARMQEYQLHQDLLYMSAPGTIWAIQAGGVIGQSNTSNTAYRLSNNTLLHSLGLYIFSANDKISIRGQEYTINRKMLGPIEYFESMFTLFASADASKLGAMDVASVLQQDNLAKANPAITPDQAQMMVNLLSDSIPQFDFNIINKIKNKQDLNGDEKEYLGYRIASYAIAGVSASAMSDIIARRYASGGQSKSVMEVMSEHSKARFQKPEWYNSVAVASDTALLREIAQMMAYNQYVAHQQFKITEQQVALLASINAVMVKLSLTLDNVNREMNASRAQGKVLAPTTSTSE